MDRTEKIALVAIVIFSVIAITLPFVTDYQESSHKSRQTDIEQVTDNTLYLHEQTDVIRVLDKSTGTICYVLKWQSISCVQIIMPSKSKDDEL